MNNSSSIEKYLLSKFVGYFDGKINSFYFNENNELQLRVKPKTEPTPALLIVAREYYSESNKSYPIVNKKELSKILKLDAVNNDQKYCIWKALDNNTEVNTWCFYKSVPAALFQLPESLIFSLTISDDKFISASKNKLLYIAKKNKTIISLEQSIIIKSSSDFIMSAGFSPNLVEEKIDKNNYLYTLFFGLKKLSLPLLLNFIQKNSSNLTTLGKKVVVPSIAIFTLYMVFSSLFLKIKEYNLANEVSQQKEQIDLALSQQQKIDTTLVRYKVLKDFLVDQKISSPVWLLLFKIMPEVYISNIRLVRDRYVIRGSSTKATDLLSTISNYNGVKNAKFDYPTRNSRGLEIFVIGFSFKLPVNNKGE